MQSGHVRCKSWLGWRDSLLSINLQKCRGTKTFVPVRIPTITNKIKTPTQGRCFYLGWDGGIRTPECMDQNHVPYHLATSQYMVQYCEVPPDDKEFDPWTIVFLLALRAQTSICLNTWQISVKSSICTESSKMLE